MDERKISADATFYDETIVSKADIVDGQRVILRAERLHVEKSVVRGRVARISRRVVSIEKTFTVALLHEELVIEYVDGDLNPMSQTSSESIVIQLHAEECRFEKTVRVVEEISLAKARVERIESVSVDLQREVLDIHPVGTMCNFDGTERDRLVSKADTFPLEVRE